MLTALRRATARQRIGSAASSNAARTAAGGLTTVTCESADRCAVFVVSVENPKDFEYQWYKNTANCPLKNGNAGYAVITGANKWHLGLKDVNSDAAGFYFCRVRSKKGDQYVDSTEASLFVVTRSWLTTTAISVTGPLTPTTATSRDCNGQSFTYRNCVKFKDLSILSRGRLAELRPHPLN